MDPSEREERVMDGLLVIAMNKHREICTIQSSGGIMLVKDQVNLCFDHSLSYKNSFLCYNLDSEISLTLEAKKSIPCLI